jgi:SCY1-like protein 2
VDAALRSLPVILPVLDFSTIKNELFPVVATVFSKTTSLGIKIRGLDAFVILCGGSSNSSNSDGLDGITSGSDKKSVSSALDKYTMQEKILPLIKGIKTKEPAVMLAALKVLRQVGSVADTEFIAIDILPVLWTMSLGPLLDLKQFQSFIDLIKSLSARVEEEHTKKLQELSGSSKVSSSNEDFLSFGGVPGFTSNNVGNDNAEDDFERLVQGKVSGNGASSVNPMDAGWDLEPNKPAVTAKNTATFSWSTPSPSTHTAPSAAGFSASILQPQQAPVSRTITPDLSRFDTLKPSTTQFSQPLQPTNTTNPYNTSTPLQPQIQSPTQSSVNWSMATNHAWPSTSITPTTSMAGIGNSMSNMSLNQRPAMNTLSTFSLPPPPASTNNSFQMPQPQRPNIPSVNSGSFNQQQTLQSSFGGSMGQQQMNPPTQKSGLDKWESLL